MGDVLGRQSRVIHIFAKKYANRLKTILSDLNAARADIQSLNENYKIKEEEATVIIEKLEKIANSQSKLKQKKSRIEQLKDSITEKEKQAELLKTKTENLMDTDEYKQYLKIKEQINSLSSEKINIKNEIDDQFTKISRPLSKYVHVSSLDKPQKQILINLVANPFEVIAKEKTDDIITILQAVRKGGTIWLCFRQRPGKIYVLY